MISVFSEEEREAIWQCAVVTNTIKNRLVCLDALLLERKSVQTVGLEALEPELGGGLWAQTVSSILDEGAIGPLFEDGRCRYEPPPPEALSGVGLFKFLSQPDFIMVQCHPLCIEQSRCVLLPGV